MSQTLALPPRVSGHWWAGGQGTLLRAVLPGQLGLPCQDADTVGDSDSVLGQC